MNAVISGRAGLALLIDDESLMSVDVDDLGTAIPRSRSDLRFLLGDATDLVLLENTDQTQIAQRLDLEHNMACALDMTLIALDPGASMDLRVEAIAALDELLADSRVMERLEFSMYAKPLPDSADLTGALFCTEATTEARAFFERLEQSQTSIRAVREAWDVLPDRLFGDQATVKFGFHDAVVREGLFRQLVSSYGDQAKVSAFLIEALKNTSIRRVPNHREVIQWWSVPLRNGAREGEQQVDSEHEYDYGEGTETPQLERRRNRRRHREPAPAIRKDWRTFASWRDATFRHYPEHSRRRRPRAGIELAISTLRCQLLLFADQGRRLHL